MLLLAVLSLLGLATADTHYNRCKCWFKYAGKWYFGTTKAGHHRQWCYLQAGGWDNVLTNTIPAQKTKLGGTCKSSSSWGGDTFHGCSSIGHHWPWCYIVTKSGGHPWHNCKRPDSHLKTCFSLDFRRQAASSRSVEESRFEGARSEGYDDSFEQYFMSNGSRSVGYDDSFEEYYMMNGSRSDYDDDRYLFEEDRSVMQEAATVVADHIWAVVAVALIAVAVVGALLAKGRNKGDYQEVGMTGDISIEA